MFQSGWTQVGGCDVESDRSPTSTMAIDKTEPWIDASLEVYITPASKWVVRREPTTWTTQISNFYPYVMSEYHFPGYLRTRGSLRQSRLLVLEVRAIQSPSWSAWKVECWPSKWFWSFRSLISKISFPINSLILTRFWLTDLLPEVSDPVQTSSHTTSNGEGSFDILRVSDDSDDTRLYWVGLFDTRRWNVGTIGNIIRIAWHGGVFKFYLCPWYG